jgi:hypothetical protein
MRGVKRHKVHKRKTRQSIFLHRQKGVEKNETPEKEPQKIKGD